MIEFETGPGQDVTRELRPKGDSLRGCNISTVTIP